MALSLSKKQENTTSKEFSGNNSGTPHVPSEVRAGLLVAISAIVLVGLLIASSRSHLFQPMNERKVLFSYIAGLAENAPVHFAGHNVGKVEKIRFISSPKTQVEVTISVSKDVPVRKDSEAYIDALGFMGEKYVEITAGTPEAPLLGENDPLTGTDPIPMMEMIKKGNEVLDEFQKTSGHMRKLTEDLGAIVGKNQEELDNIFKNLDTASGNLSDMTADLKAHPWKLLKKK